MKLLDLLFPPKCVFCRSLLESSGGPGICPKCEKSIPKTKNGGVQSGEFFDICVAPCYYEDLVKDALRAYKFRDCSAYAGALGSLLADCVQQTIPERFDLVSWVPLSRRRLRERGYDQAKLLAREVSRAAGVPMRPLLRKIRNNPAQSGTGGPAERRANVNGVYAAVQDCTGLRVLLVDDIVTTGATFSECARVLRMAGAKSVVCAAVARGRD